ncbi:O-antigen ligase domain-containing protein [Seongchinamella unica]|uniref:O-antigen ligase domain-containing protein n=1 Tax=Seongchinamella unica TaxID=2547392 RepID=A0A4R5LQU0_9GAMM|nr:O-antigen ligase family protein [Seongchinamella unica]TDG12899.1 O-antigen ligase domain-containing protein [Seongchinamella unica]
MPSFIPGRLESGLFAFYLAILVWAPLPFASNRPWAAGLLVVLVSCLLLGWLLLFLAGRTSIGANAWHYGRWPLALLVLVQCWVLLQGLPLPRPVVAMLSPEAFAWHLREGWLSLSLDPTATRFYLLQGCALTAAFFLTIALINSQRRLRLLLQVLVFSGTFQAAYGAFMVLSGLEYGFLVEKYAGQGVATGTFVNRNHLAGYLVMCLAAGIGLLLSQLAVTGGENWKQRLERWLRLLLSAKIRLRIYLAVMVIALVLTRSRMGNVAFFTSLAFAGTLYMVASGRFSSRVLAFLGSLLVVDMFILGRWFGFDQLVQRLEQTNPETEGRVWSNAYTWDYLQHFPLTGSGGGSYYGVFPNFQPADLPGFYDHAHNDYLEFAVELGLPAAAALLAVVILCAVQALRALRTRRTPLLRGAAFAVLMTIAWAAIHSTADFNLQIPANALTFVIILAMAVVVRALPGGAAAPFWAVKNKANNL